MAKRIKPNFAAMKERLEKRKEKTQRKKISIEDNPIFKVEGPGKYRFRATYYPHSEDPAAEPFPVRYYHFGIPGGVVYCPAKNAGEECALCEFVWSQMKIYGKNGTSPDKQKVFEWSDRLPKARVWIPGFARGREEEGFKFFTIGTADDRMSKNHQKLYEWFEDEDYENWIDPDNGNDIQIEYEAYEDDRAKRFRVEFGLSGISLRKSSPFGIDFDEFMESIPNIDDNDIDALQPWRRRTSDEAREVLSGWMTRLAGSRITAHNEEVDTSESEGSDDEETAPTPSFSNDKLKEKLEKLGIKTG